MNVIACSTGVTGKELKVLIFRKLAKAAWPASTSAAVRLATIVRELPMTADQAVAILERLIHRYCTLFLSRGSAHIHT